MYSRAQQKFLELRKNGIHAALFEGSWMGENADVSGLIFELGKKLLASEAVTKMSAVCGFKTYEGEEHFFEIIKINEFVDRQTPPMSNVENISVPKRMSTVSFNKYVETVSLVKELITAGETYQVNYSIPFEVSAVGVDPFEIYCTLTRLNPSPYMCFIETQAGALISNSPECLYELSVDQHVKTMPIKGTTMRGQTPREDERNAVLLLESEKNKAELAMIVDLERNDLGKVCTPGTVRVHKSDSGDFRVVEKYSHVIHTVAKIEGTLESGKTWRDLLDALSPGGSITGCPKIRTMEIIKKIEEGPRGIYCGSAGFVLPNKVNAGAFSVFNILIRSLWFDKKSQKVVFRSGGGIVADSNAIEEYTELINKAAAIESALNSLSY